MQFFHRTPYAQQPYELDEIIPAIPESSFVDDNSPLADKEVRFDDDLNERKRSIFLDWHDNNSEQELEIVAGFNSVRRELLNEVLKERTALHGTIKTLAVTMATQNARAHALFFTQNGFTRAADRSRNTWTYVCDLEAQRQRKKARKRRRIVDVKEKPKEVVPELKPLLTVQQYADKAVELEQIRLKIKKLEEQ